MNKLHGYVVLTFDDATIQLQPLPRVKVEQRLIEKISNWRSIVWAINHPLEWAAQFAALPQHHSN